MKFTLMKYKTFKIMFSWLKLYKIYAVGLCFNQTHAINFPEHCNKSVKTQKFSIYMNKSKGLVNNYGLRGGGGIEMFCDGKKIHGLSLNA